MGALLENRHTQEKMKSLTRRQPGIFVSLLLKRERTTSLLLLSVSELMRMCFPMRHFGAKFSKEDCHEDSEEVDGLLC